MECQFLEGIIQFSRAQVKRILSKLQILLVTSEGQVIEERPCRAADQSENLQELQDALRRPERSRCRCLREGLQNLLELSLIDCQRIHRCLRCLARGLTGYD